MVLSFLKKAGKQLKQDIFGGLNLLSTAFARPLQTTAALIKRDPQRILSLVEETEREKPATVIKKTVITTALGVLALKAAPLAFIPKTIGGKLLGLAGISAVLTSPKIAKLVEPTGLVEKALRGGEIAGEFAETGKAPSIPTALKVGGLVGGAAALAAGGLIVAKKIKEKIKGAPDLAIFPEGTAIQPEPISAIPKEIPKEMVAAEAARPQLPSIKNVFKPEVNISFRKSRRFINQQINIK